VFLAGAGDGADSAKYLLQPFGPSTAQSPVNRLEQSQ
jgi:hypothetical protein